MNYIERVGVNVPLGQIFFGLAVFALVAMVVFILVENRRTKGEWPGKSFIVFLALLVTLAGGVTTWIALAASTTSMAYGNQQRAFQEQAEQTYGITLRDEQFENLKYPVDRPKGGTQSFGSFDQTSVVGDGKFLKRELTLVWTNGKMVLAESTNGEDFTPLKAKG